MKNKLILLSLLTLVIFSPLSFIKAEVDNADTTPVSSFADKIPNFLKKTYTKVINATEGWREKTLLSLRERLEKINNSTKESASSEEVTAPDVLNGDEMTPKNFLKPVQYVEKVFYSGLEAVFSNEMVFYGIIFMILLIIILRIFG